MRPLKPAIIERPGPAEIRALKELAHKNGMPITDVDKVIEEAIGGECWMNDTYTVISRELDLGMKVVHLSIRRNDRAPVTDWRDKQAIKNQLVGEFCEGVEIYPSETRLVDTANQYHLWVFKDPNYRFPLGFTERFVANQQNNTKAKQRNHE